MGDQRHPVEQIARGVNRHGGTDAAAENRALTEKRRAAKRGFLVFGKALAKAHTRFTLLTLHPSTPRDALRKRSGLCRRFS
jgi:hypothetical protein